MGKSWAEDVNRCQFVAHTGDIECGRFHSRDRFPYGACTRLALSGCGKAPHWVTYRPVEILAKIGITTEKRRSEELDFLFDGDLSGYYYVAMASDGTDEAIKWIMSSLAAHLNDRKLPFRTIYRIMPADYLKTFVAYMKAAKFEKGYAKDIFAELLKADHHIETNLFDMTPDEVDTVIAAGCWTRRLTGDEILDRIIADPRFKAVDASEIDAIIETVIAANADKAAKAVEQPQLVQWFVGQVMKAAKGKATGAVVIEKLKEIFK